MRAFYKKNILFFISLYYTLLAGASVNVNVQHLTTADGLSNNSVRYIFQDSKGFIWMSTLNGLNRYDGNSFVTFLPENNKSISLIDRRVKHLLEDANGFLWISTSADQFSCYDLKRDCFVDFTGCGEYTEHYGYILSLPNEVWLWGRNHGCRRIEYRNERFVSEAFHIENRKLKSDNVRFLSPGKDGKIWIGTDKGLYYWLKGELRCIDNSRSFQRVHSFSDKTCFITMEGEIWTIDTKGTLTMAAVLPGISSSQDLPGEIVINNQWVIFTRNGGFCFDPQTNQLKQAPDKWNIANGQVITDNQHNYWVFNKTGKLHYIQTQNGDTEVFQLMSPEKSNLLDNERYHVIHDSHGTIWISTYGNGLFTYDVHTRKLNHFKADDSRSSLITSNTLFYILEDRSGSIWVSSEYTGVSHLRVVNEGAFHLNLREPRKDDEEDGNANNIRMIASTNQGDIYIGTREGRVFIYDSTFTKLKKEELYSKNIYFICEDHKGVLWKGSRGDGVYIGDKQYVHQTNNKSSISANEIFSILRDSQNRMWIGTFGGGLNLAVANEKGEYIFRHFFNDDYSQRRIRSLIEDKQGWIWVGTSDGVIVFRPEQLLNDDKAYYQYNWSNQSLQSDEIRYLMQDSKGNIWITETGAGFSICTPGTAYDKLQFVHYGVEDGLVNNMTQAFVEDKDGMMWITTEYGVSRFNPQTKTFENFFFSKEIMQNIYSENSAFRLNDGRIAMGTKQGLTLIDPTQIQNIQHEPTVTFTSLKLHGILVNPNEQDSPLNKSLAYANSINLRYNQNSFVIEFSTLDYSTSIPPKFSYLLENYDKGWSTPSGLNFASYKNLEPGTYRLHVKACNATGQWGNQEAVLEIVIVPPFWQTTWAYCIYVLLVMGTCYLIYRIVRNTTELQNKIKVEEQLTEYKLTFFTNISHEFRTPLTLIQAALEKMQINKIPKELVYPVKVMDKNTNRMLRLINQLLEFRKMQHNKLHLSLEKTDVIAFLYEIYLSFEDTAESKRMDARFTPSVDTYKMFIDKSYIDKIIYNVLSNAFKYTPSEGKVLFDIQVDEEAQKLIIKVTDSGVGIPKEKQGQLFSRFMQSSFSSSSIGIGLNLTYELVHVHKGSISYEENPEGGSIFTVVLPTSPKVYQEADFLIADNVLIREEETPSKFLPAAHMDKEEAGKLHSEDTKATIEISEPLNKRKILIIEDDTDVREFLKKELSEYFEVVAEADGKAGLARAYEYDADLIVCDVMMPGYSGYEVTQKLKSDFNTSHIPIILLTALNADENYLEGITSGADVYITKPFSTKLLLTRIFKLIEQRDKLREKFSSDISIVRPVICTTDKDKEFADRLMKIIEEQLDNSEFTVEDFAASMMLGRSIFYTKVRGVTGYSPKEYLRIIRMKKAAELLISTDTTVSEAAYKVGISDPFYFSKCFKAQFGVSPSVYQKSKGEAVTNND